MLFALLFCSNMFAFEFDGINLSDEVIKITRQVAKRGYVTDPERNCFKGNCQGQEIYLSFDYENVSSTNHVGALIIEVPMKNANAYDNCVEILNVIYHQAGKEERGVRYIVDNDGTTLLISPASNGIKLTYYTPYFKVKKRK